MSEKVRQKTNKVYLEVWSRCWLTRYVVEGPGSNNVETGNSNAPKSQIHIIVCGHVYPICVGSIEAEQPEQIVRAKAQVIGKKAVWRACCPTESLRRSQRRSRTYYFAE